MMFVVLGAGALGSIIAGHLARAGEEVTLVARGNRAKLLREKGITITGLVDFTGPCTVVEDPNEVSEADVLIVTVKTYDMASALAGIRHLDVSSALSVQNGVLKNEQLAQVFGKEKVLGAAAMFSGELLPEGPVRFTLNRCFSIGELPEGTSQRVQDIVGALENAGIHAEAAPQIQTIEWSKFISWIGFMALAVLTRVETHKFLSDADTAAVAVRMMREAAALAEALGIPLEDRPPIPVKAIASIAEQEAVGKLREVGVLMGGSAPTHRVSTLQDLERGRRLEVEETLGYVVKKAGEEGVAVQTIETCYRLVSGINRFGSKS
jgi:2-dehydropantoate 2-reductase